MATPGARDLTVLHSELGSLAEQSPRLQLGEVCFFPHIPANIVHVEWIGESSGEDGGLQVVRLDNVGLEEIHRLLAEASQEDAFEIAVFNGPRRLSLDETGEFGIVEIFETQCDAVSKVEVVGLHHVTPVTGSKEREQCFQRRILRIGSHPHAHLALFRVDLVTREQRVQADIGYRLASNQGA